MRPLAYADTSLLASIYLEDANSRRADRLLADSKAGVVTTPLSAFELRNAFKLALFRRAATDAEVEEAWDHWQADLAAGVFLTAPVPDNLFATAEGLASLHTARLGTRALDVVHVAAAVALGARQFLSFDRRQCALAKAAGLAVPAS